MKLIKFLALSLLAILPILGMERQPQSWKEWLLGTPIKPLQESETLLTFLPRELKEELKKFITNDKKSAQAFWTLKQIQQNNSYEKNLIKHTPIVTALCYDSVANQLYSRSCNDNDTKIWDLNTNTCIATLTGKKATLAYNPIIKQLFSGSRDGIKGWDLNTNICIDILTGYKDIIALAYNSITNQLYSVSRDTIKVWDLNLKTCIATHIIKDSIKVTAFAYNSGANQLYLGCNDHTFKVFQLEEPNLTQEFNKINVIQTLALQQAYECATSQRPLNAKILALLDHGPANLDSLKKVIKENCKIK